MRHYMRLIIIRIDNNSHSQTTKGKDKDKMKKLTLLALFASLIVSSFVTANEVNIFNARHYKADNELYSKFTEKTGIKVNLINGKAGA